MKLNAIIDDEYLLYSKDEITFTCRFLNGEFNPLEDFDKVIDIIRNLKQEKQKLINIGFQNDKKVIMDLKTETKYFYKLDGVFKEEYSDIPKFITKMIDGSKVIVFSEPANKFSKYFIPFDGEIPDAKGFPSLPTLYNTIDNLIDEEHNILIDEDYKDNNLVNEKTHLKLILEIINPLILMNAYKESNDKLIINELNKFLSLEECYMILKLDNLELIKKLFLKVNDFDIKKDLICMSLINSLHNKLEVEKYYFEEDLISEYAYVRKNGKLVILHDQNRFI